MRRPAHQLPKPRLNKNQTLIRMIRSSPRSSPTVRRRLPRYWMIRRRHPRRSRKITIIFPCLCAG
ncbi:MAG: hypothetical protein AMJ79_07545 [Phycisphaerae bacterium SM23_30]|nr:MAG: hypothetical protein AMJ79_07545 [Phycisphaerae bacterium SM23_30]